MVLDSLFERFIYMMGIGAVGLIIGLAIGAGYAAVTRWLRGCEERALDRLRRDDERS